MKKRVNFIIWLLLIVVIPGMGLLMPMILTRLEGVEPNHATDTERVVYSEAYTESLRQEVIRELYGSREQYAKEQTGSRADYVDREASMSGEMVVDEARMQQVYESKLLEFDAKVDEAKVEEILRQRQESLAASGAYEDPYKVEKTLTGEQIRWRQSRNYILITDGLVLIGYGFYRYFKKK